MKPDLSDYVAIIGFCAMTAGIYLLFGAPITLLVDGSLLLGLALRA